MMPTWWKTLFSARRTARKARRPHAPRWPRAFRPLLEQLERRDTPAPGAGQALVRLEAIGVNFIDIYHRTGLYKLAMPFTPGSEAAGVVVETGQRVAYAMVPGAYAWECRITPCASTTKTERASMPRSSLKTPYALPTTPCGQKSDNSGKGRPPSCSAHALRLGTGSALICNISTLCALKLA